MSQPLSNRNTRPLAALMFKLPLMIDCIAFEGFILEYIDGTLPRRQRFIFEMHLRMCRECRNYLAEYQNTIALVGSQKDMDFSDMGMGPVPEDLINAVLAAQRNPKKK